MTQRLLYGVYNTRADTRRHSNGFDNTWAVVAFRSKAERDEFLEVFEHKLARIAFRKQAEQVWARNYGMEGLPVPAGGWRGRYGQPAYDMWSEIRSDLPQFLEEAA